MNFFYKHLLNRQLKKRVGNPEREKAFQSLNEITTILVLFDVKDYDAANYFIQKLKKMKKRLTVCAFVPRGYTMEYHETNINFIYEKGLKIWNDEMMLRTVSISPGDPFDMAVNFALDDNVYLQYILASVDSPLKAGFYRSSLHIHDLIISSPYESEETDDDKLKGLGDQLIFYLRTISSGNKE
ncbi:MAG: hypothetical protein LBR64_00390 [Dysgonamonadaceae bacterium]|jgi:hypothetical protein|nr:hypothetical protein [Dysgonamonadaceae bacterium]